MAAIDSSYSYLKGPPSPRKTDTLVERREPRRLRKIGRAILFKDAGPTKAWYGVLTIFAICSWLGYVGLRLLMSSDSVREAIDNARARAVGPVLLVFVAVILLAEQFWPAVPRPLFSRAHLVDAGYLALYAAIVMPLLTLVETGFDTEIGRHAHFLVLARLPIGSQIIVSGLILVGIDAMNWAAHVANHRSLTLWRLHALHHSQEDMSVLTTFRTHPLVHASYLPSLFPALILGASGVVPGIAIIVYGCLVTLPHANVRWTFGPFGHVFVSPAYHRLHHALTPIDERGTVNFGFVLVTWDQLLHRAAFPAKGAPILTGLADRSVPIEQTSTARGTPRVMLAQLAQPFKVHSTTDGPA